MAVDFDKINSYREKIQPRDNTRVSNKLEPKLKKEEEKKQFIIENKRHFIKGVDPNNKTLIEGIKLVPSVIPGFLGVKSLMNMNNESK